MDVEGTTTSISYVHDVLFPFSKDKMCQFVEENGDILEVENELNKVVETVLKEEDKVIEVCDTAPYLIKWIVEDRKHPALKTIQGFIWKLGYQKGKLKGHVYNDIPLRFRSWSRKFKLAIYSSGSVEAQEMLFKHSIAGDLTPYLNHHFDTAVGAKKEVASYKEIAKQRDVEPEAILFLSDIVEELDAATDAGMQVTQLFRDDVPEEKYCKHPYALTFNDLVIK